MNPVELIKKAKATLYKNKTWFIEGDKSVYDAMKYYAMSGDFYLAVPKKLLWLSSLETVTGEKYTGQKSVTELVKWLISIGRFDLLLIKGEGGSDKGKLKAELFCFFKQIKVSLEPDYGEDEDYQRRWMFELLENGIAYDGNNGFTTKDEAFEAGVASLSFVLSR